MCYHKCTWKKKWMSPTVLKWQPLFLFLEFISLFFSHGKIFLRSFIYHSYESTSRRAQVHEDLCSGGSRGAPPAHTPLWVHILSFWHTNFSKHSCLGSWCHPYEVGAPYGKSWIRHRYVSFLSPSVIRARELQYISPFRVFGFFDALQKSKHDMVYKQMWQIEHRHVLWHLFGTWVCNWAIIGLTNETCCHKFCWIEASDNDFSTHRKLYVGFLCSLHHKKFYAVILERIYMHYIHILYMYNLHALYTYTIHV